MDLDAGVGGKRVGSGPKPNQISEENPQKAQQNPLSTLHVSFMYHNPSILPYICTKNGQGQHKITDHQAKPISFPTLIDPRLPNFERSLIKAKTHNNNTNWGLKGQRERERERERC